MMKLDRYIEAQWEALRELSIEIAEIEGKPTPDINWDMYAEEQIHG